MFLHLLISILLFIVLVNCAISSTYGGTSYCYEIFNLQNATTFSLVNFKGEKIYTKNCIHISIEEAEPIDNTRVKIRVKGTSSSPKAIFTIIYFNNNAITFSHSEIVLGNDRRFNKMIELILNPSSDVRWSYRAELLYKN